MNCNGCEFHPELYYDPEFQIWVRVEDDGVLAIGMTDISPWPALIHTEGNYVMVPLNAYQMGNLLDALAQVPETGDWWSELQDIIGVAMRVGNIEQVASNTGRTFTLDNVLDRDIRK